MVFQPLSKGVAHCGGRARGPAQTEEVCFTARGEGACHWHRRGGAKRGAGEKTEHEGVIGGERGEEKGAG